MEFGKLVEKSRTIRRFKESVRIENSTLEYLVNLARLSPSGANRQPLKFMIFTSKNDCDRIFPSTLWAGYLKEWPGPDDGERPSGYIIVLGDKSVAENFGVDHGIAAQSIMLGASELGLGGCIIASIRRNDLASELHIPESFEILLVLALGMPLEEVVIDEIKDGDVKYWRDENRVHHVPKRKLEDLIIRF